MTPQAQKRTGSFNDLTRRTISALAIATGALLATVAGAGPFSVMCAIGAGLLCWELNAMLRPEPFKDPIVWIQTIGTVTAVIITYFIGFWPGLVCLTVAALTAILPTPSKPGRVLNVLGVLYVGAACICLLTFRSGNPGGLWVILFLYLMVWGSDIAAYFAGRKFGGPKLAPTISPGKTWSGFAAGLIVPALLAGLFAGLYRSAPIVVLSVVGIVLALASQAGDLLESALKRRTGVKDSGSLIPGHGGLFDRVDGLIGATYAAAIIALGRGLNVTPKGVLFW